MKFNINDLKIEYDQEVVVLSGQRKDGNPIYFKALRNKTKLVHRQIIGRVEAFNIMGIV